MSEQVQRIQSRADWEELGILCELKLGKSFRKADVSREVGEFPVINGTAEPCGFVNYWNTEDAPIGITKSGINVGKVSWCEGKYFRGNLNYGCTILDKNRLLDRFLYYVLCSKESEVRSLSNFGVMSLPSIRRNDLEKIEIPVPSLESQNLIVTLLDNYTTSLDALIGGFEVERKIRLQQYEYHRNRMLSFERLGER